MALVKGTNSYATVEEADLYFADRLDVAAWTSADSTSKAQALVTATSMLDGFSWTGYAVSDSQALAFPRVGEYFDPRVGMTVQFTNSVPSRIITATYEMAHHLLNNDGLLDDTGTVDELTVGPITLKNIRNSSKTPSNVSRLIGPMLATSSTRMWWRAN